MCAISASFGIASATCCMRVICSKPIERSAVVLTNVPVGVTTARPYVVPNVYRASCGGLSFYTYGDGRGVNEESCANLRQNSHT